MPWKNPWKQNPWFESVAVAQERARKRLPKPVYAALLAGCERGQTIADNQQAFADLGLAPHVAGHHDKRELATTVLGQEIGFPVIISPTGVQAVHPDGEVAVARAAAARGHGDGAVQLRLEVGRGGRGGQRGDVLPDVLDRRPRRDDPPDAPGPRRRGAGADRHPGLVLLHGP